MDGHPLRVALEEAARGRMPPADGSVVWSLPPVGSPEAIVAFTGHAHLMTTLEPETPGTGRADAFGGALHPEVQLALARGGSIGVNDATTAWVRPDLEIGPAASVEPTSAFDDHPRVRHARSVRASVKVFGGDHGLITLARGLVGRLEMGVEVWEPGNGRGRALIAAAQQRCGVGEALFASVSPGNARSLRAFLGAGFAVIASEVVIRPGGDR